MLGVADNLTNSEDSSFKTGLARSSVAEVFGNQLRLSVSHILCVAQRYRQGFRYQITWRGRSRRDRGTEVERCGLWSLGGQAKVQQILRACDAIRFEALESFVEVHRPGEMDHVCDGAADLTVIALVEPKVRVAKVRW